MMPSGPPTPVGGAQSVNPSLLRSNSSILGGGGSNGGQNSFPSLVSPRNQYNNINLLGNIPNVNVSSLLNQSFGNGGGNSGSGRGGMDTGAESDPLSGVGNGMNFTPSVTFAPSNGVNSNPNSGSQNQVQFPSSSGNQLGQDQMQHQQLELQNYQHGGLQQQYPSSQNQQQQHQQQQLQQQQSQQQHYQSIRAGLGGGGGSVKMEPQMSSDQNGAQQLQSLRNLGHVKMEPQQMQGLRSLGPVKMEPQHSDQSLFLQQQQQQQFLQMSRQNSQAAAQMNLLQQQQQRIFNMQQQQQQQQILKTLPQQRSQIQQQFQQQNMPVRAAAKPAYEPGMCARRLTHYMYHQQHRPADNNIEFWRKFVAEYFAPHAKKRWCVSLYGSGRQTTGVFPQDVWHCEICNRKPGRGFETTVEVLPRLCKIKYDSGTLEELLYVDMPREYQNTSGQIVLDYAKAIQESVFEQLRVVRDGQLRIVFSPDLKICSWEFCARRHEELIPRRLIIQQVSQLGAAAQKYQTSTQNAPSSLSAQELQNNCNMFVASARQLAKALEVPLVNDLGYTKRYVRCLQISEVVNSMKDLIDYSRETGTGPMASLINFPRRTGGPSGLQNQAPQSEDQQQQQNIAQNSNNGQQASMQLGSPNGGVATSVNNPTPTSTTTASTIVGLLHQNSMNTRHENGGNTPYGGSGGGGGSSTVQIPSASSSSSLTQPQLNNNPSSPFASPTPSTSNNIALPVPPSTGTHISAANSPANNNISSMVQQPAQSSDADMNDSQSSVQQIIQEMMMSSQLNGGGGVNGGGSMIGVGGGSLSNDIKMGVVGNGVVGNNMGFGNMGGVGGGNNNSNNSNGMRGAPMNGRGMSQDLSSMHHQQQQADLGNRLLNGLGTVNGFNNLQFDWKTSP